MKVSVLSSFFYQLLRTRKVGDFNDPKTDETFNEEWLTRLGLTIKNELVFTVLPDDKNRIIVLGSLFDFAHKKDLLALPGSPLLWDEDRPNVEPADELMIHCSMTYEKLRTKVIYLVNRYTDTSGQDRIEECAVSEMKAYSDFFSSPTMYSDRYKYYRKVWQLRSELFGNAFWRKTPLLAAQLLLCLPVPIVVAMFKHDLPYDKVLFLIENRIHISEWNDSMYKEYPIEWLMEMASDG